MGRIETGPVRIDGDWPGVFIRGDDCMKIRGLLEKVGSGSIAFRHNFDSLLNALGAIVDGEFEADRYRRSSHRQQLYTMTKPEDQTVTIKNGRRVMNLTRQQAAIVVQSILETLSDPMRRSEIHELGE